MASEGRLLGFLGHRLLAAAPLAAAAIHKIDLEGAAEHADEIRAARKEGWR
jgi:hypothetical protein